jgi:hypothetical protein
MKIKECSTKILPVACVGVKLDTAQDKSMKKTA